MYRPNLERRIFDKILYDVDSSANPQTGGPPPVICPQLLIQYIRN
jgi:hypothetical protein